MAQLVVRNLEESVKTALQARAKLRGHSLEAEVRDTLRTSVATSGPEQVGLGTWMASLFSGQGLGIVIEEQHMDIPPVDFSSDHY